MQSEPKEVKYFIQGMDCADCALSLEKSLANIQGVEQVNVNFTTGFLEANGSFEPQALVKRVEALGYQVVTPGLAYPNESQNGNTQAAGSLRLPGFLGYLYASTQTRMALLGAVLLLLSIPFALFGSGLYSQWIKTGLQLAAAGLAGYPIVNRGVRALFIGRQITIDLLMSIATLGALFIGEISEACTVVLLFSIGEALEGYTADKARRSLQSLLSLKPERAHVMRPCIDCEEHMGQGGYTGGPCPECGEHELTLPVEQIAIGERVIVRPGERIPVDGHVLSGISLVNQAPVTGESVPVQKAPGDKVYAGTLNGEAVLELSVSQIAAESTISRIVRLVDQAQAQRAPVERSIDRFASWYTPAVVVLAACVAVIPPLLFGAPFFDINGTHGWLYRALTLLIVACPCALVISTPVTMVSSLTALAGCGVLVKGGKFIDVLARARLFAFDKTGTLTVGQPTVTHARSVDCLPDALRCPACEDMLALAATVEQRSEHPLAQAIMAEVQRRQLTHTYPAAESVQSLAGQGVQGISNGSSILVGSHDLFHARDDALDHQLHEDIQSAMDDGQTVMLVGKDDYLVGYVSVADAPRPTTADTLRQLKAIDPRFSTVMLTGDNPTVAARVALTLGSLDEVRAGLLPEDKLNAVRDLQAAHGLVVMVGDGVNDAPALAAADTGIAMGGAGSAQAMETADVVLMQDDLTHLPGTIQTARQTQAIIKQNIAFSLVVKAVFLLLTLPGLTTLWMAVFADMGASLLVTLNGMRMLRKKI
ncbi:MAG: cation-translocating P-type ATPase [Anaerolineae bacterium]|nr:cation-translocating P-type ATPase [Anaerolineae bacterium]